MKWLICFLSIVAIGLVLAIAVVVSRPAAAPVKIQPTEFDTGIAAVLKQAHKMQSLVEMGAPQQDRVLQGIVMRGAIAELVPITADDQIRFAAAVHLVKVLENYSVNLDYLAVATDRCRRFKHTDDSETWVKALADQAAEFQKVKAFADAAMTAVEQTQVQQSDPQSGPGRN